ncbi:MULTISPECIES: TVP38/TMEM64 family protein [Bacillaceae]|uniref:TVP38/TMEM64 family protein n=1 Tax=Bacillaceae TaxID=186817 RepID=UPI003000246C
MKAKKDFFKVLISFFALIFVFFLLRHEGLEDSIYESIKYLKDGDVEEFRDYLLTFGPFAAVVSGLLMVFQSIIAPLPAFVITFANGLLFGWGLGAILSWSSAMLGAILCFYLAKWMGRPVVEKIVTKKALQWWDVFFAKYGKQAVFIARIVPIVSFDLVSYAAGLTSISFWPFFWATGLGQLPATILYSYLGQSATSTVKIIFFLFTIAIALAVIGIILRPKWKEWGNRKQGVKG